MTESEGEDGLAGLEWRFVGDPHRPDRATCWCQDRGMQGLVAGDQVQVELQDICGDKSAVMRIFCPECRRDSLDLEGRDRGSYQALVTARLAARPTTPIEHIDYPDDYDLEQLAAAEPHLLRPCNDALHIEPEFMVDDVSPVGEGDELPSQVVPVDE